MEFDKKHGYLIQWLIGIGDLLVLNLLFFAVWCMLGCKRPHSAGENPLFAASTANNL